MDGETMLMVCNFLHSICNNDDEWLKLLVDVFNIQFTESISRGAEIPQLFGCQEVIDHTNKWPLGAGWVLT